MIYNNIGILINNQEIWMKKLEEVKKFINENNKRPCTTSKNKNEKL